ncbi:conserved hypothetical protein [Ricinus communis]|uniref:Uncharacterized protein n=1 Tax=Ricinus communis TaxID=3988 RepID=B9TB01_RICCO|nr:conserved hypothetical protein [Ricinus communis]
MVKHGPPRGPSRTSASPTRAYAGAASRQAHSSMGMRQATDMTASRNERKAKAYDGTAVGF